MSANDNPPSDTAADFQALDILDRELTVGISMAEARVQRLLKAAYASPVGAERTLRKLIPRIGVDETVKVMMGNGFANARHFGALRGEILRWRLPAARAALQQLPDALRDLQELINRQSDARVARQNLRTMLAERVRIQPPTLNNETAPKNVRRIRRRMF